MSWLWRIAERAIERARDDGDLDDLPLAGKPLPKSGPGPGVDPVEEAGFRIMKAEGVVPTEVTLHRAASLQRARLRELDDPEARKEAMKEIAETEMRLAMLMERRRGLRW